MFLFALLSLITALRIPKNFIISNLERNVALTDRYIEIKSKVFK